MVKINKKPYLENKISENIYLRIFKFDINPYHLKWHTDSEDRIVEVIKNINWKFQFDDELPFILKENIYIKKNIWHRIIKGDDELILKITKIK